MTTKNQLPSLQNKMTMKDWRDKVQYITAVTAALSGITLSFIQYFQTCDLTSGMLGYVGEVLVFAAGVFGTTMYVNDKVSEMKTFVKENNGCNDCNQLDNDQL